MTDSKSFARISELCNGREVAKFPDYQSGNVTRLNALVPPTLTPS